MKYIILLSFCFLFASTNVGFAQDKKDGVHLYNPAADAKKELADALKKAKSEHKQVLVQIGGNWCAWCIKFHGFIEANPSLRDSIKANYVFLLVNYDREHLQEDLMKKWEHPSRFGFPCLLVLNADGKRLHTQDSALLEKGDGYDLEKVQHFLDMWTVKAVNAKK
ncbi:MAG: thioredoxin family protein [Bacteroidia bacterium]